MRLKHAIGSHAQNVITIVDTISTQCGGELYDHLTSARIFTRIMKKNHMSGRMKGGESVYNLVS